MKFLLIIILLLSSQLALASELENISIIMPVSYFKPKDSSQNIESSAQIWLGNIIGATDIAPKVKESIAPYRDDLAPYFKNPGELDQWLDSVISEANQTIVKGKLNDKKAIEVNRFLGNNLIGKIADKILETQGVNSKDRRDLWVNKILAPFNTCITNSTNAIYDADHCMTSLTKSLVPSTGIAIVYELSKSKLAKNLPPEKQNEFNVNQANLYINCLKYLFPTADNVKLCSLQTMKSGMLKVSETSLMETINSSASSKSEGSNIKNKVWPDYSRCIQLVGTENNNKKYTEQFLSCTDGLIQSTGMLLVSDKILNSPSVKNQFSKSDLITVAKEKSEQFKNCTNKLMSENKRVNGLLDSDICKNLITNDITYQVILNNFKQSASSQFPTKNNESELTFNIGKSSLDKCWGKNVDTVERDKCIRTAIISFSLQAASLKLDSAIPKESQSKNLIKSNAIESFKRCLDKNLPTNVSESNNTTPSISSCSEVLTKEVALKIAEDEVRLTLKDSYKPEEINQSVNLLVKDQFAKCLGSQVSDLILENCSNNLKIVIAEKLVSQNIDMYLSDRPNLSLESTRENLKSELMGNYRKCLSDSSKNENCNNELKKEADRKIVLAFGKIETKAQLNTDLNPDKLILVQNKFTECTQNSTEGQELDKKLDECNKNFSIDFARNLGLLKLDFLLGNALGRTTLNEQKNFYEKIVNEYNRCLDQLYTFKMSDHLTDRIGVCTQELENRATNLVRSNLNMWMASSEKDARNLAVKNEFSSILPCLSPLLPPSPFNQSLKENVDSALKPVAILISQYIDYSPENAKSNLNDIIANLSENFRSNGGTEKAKSEIIDLLYKNGALDQFIKAMVRGKVRDSFATIDEKDLPKSVRDQLISRENFDTIFNSAEGKNIKDYVLENMLKPILLKGDSLTSPTMADSFTQVNGKVVKLLVGSPHFGDIIIKSGVQQQIDSMGGLSHFIAKIAYGSDSLNWDKVRETDAGKKAEEYIRQNVLLPKFSATTISPEEEKSVSIEAQNLVKTAVKKYTESKK